MSRVLRHGSQDDRTYSLVNLTRDEMLAITTLVGQVVMNDDGDPIATIWDTVEDVFRMGELPYVWAKHEGEDARQDPLLILDWR